MATMIYQFLTFYILTCVLLLMSSCSYAEVSVAQFERQVNTSYFLSSDLGALYIYPDKIRLNQSTLHIYDRGDKNIREIPFDASSSVSQRARLACAYGNTSIYKDNEGYILLSIDRSDDNITTSRYESDQVFSFDCRPTAEITQHQCSGEPHSILQLDSSGGSLLICADGRVFLIQAGGGSSEVVGTMRSFGANTNFSVARNLYDQDGGYLIYSDNIPSHPVYKLVANQSVSFGAIDVNLHLAAESLGGGSGFRHYQVIAAHDFMGIKTGSKIKEIVDGQSVTISDCVISNAHVLEGNGAMFAITDCGKDAASITRFQRGRLNDTR